MAQKLNPFSGRQFLDANGDPYSGAQLFVYTAGSSTKATVTKDSAGISAHANPIILNTRGEPGDGAGASQAIWQTEGESIKLVLAPSTDTDPPVSAISTWDNLVGINDTTVSIDQWVSGPTPTFIGATSFSLAGDQTSDFHVGRRIKTTNSGGTVYSTIITSAYTSLTTITVVNDSASSIDSGLSAVSYGLISATNNSISEDAVAPVYGPDIASATALPWPAYGSYSHVTGTTAITSFNTSGIIGKRFFREFDGVLTLTHHATNLILPTSANITTAAGDVAEFVEYGSGTVKCINYERADGSPLINAATLGASRVLLATQTASASASVDFTTNIDGTYDKYIIELSAVVPATGSTLLQVRFSQASSFKSDAGYYWGVNDTNQSGTNVPAGGAAASSMRISSGQNNASTYGLDGTLYLTSPSSTATYTRIYGEASYQHASNGVTTTVFSGYYVTSAAAVDGIQFFMSSGNITSGEFRLYGIKDS